jgi:dUTP pyrophosphatase
MFNLYIQYLENYNLEEWGEMTYANKGDACFDIRAAIKEPLVVYSGQIIIIPTGFRCAFNDTLVLHIYPRSGLSCKMGLTLSNSPATIDSGYRGEVKVCLINLSEMDGVKIYPGNKIAQAKLEFVPNIILKTVDKLPSGSRGENGFGSSGW